MAPTLLIESLETVRRRVRWLTVLFGVGIVAAAAVGLLLTTVLTDYLLNLHAMPRLLLITLALCGEGYVLWHWIIKSILSRLTLMDVAGRVEKTFPQYQDRLRSTVDILGGNKFPGSEIMKQRVVSEATRLTQSLDLTRVVVARPVWYSGSAGVLALLVLALLISTVGPQYRRIAMDRLFTPFRSVEWPKSVNIEMLGKIPARVSVGQRVDVNIRLSKGDKASRKALIHYQYGNQAGTQFGPEEQEFMVRGDDGVYHAAIDARTPVGITGADAGMGTLKIWMDSGDDRVDLKPVMVVQRLALSRVEALITAPPYAKLPPVRVNLLQNPARLTFGSKIQLTAQFNKDLDHNHPISVEYIADKAAKPPFKWDAPVGNTITASVDATDTFRFHLHATDIDGLSNPAAEELEFDVVPDVNPTIVIENPRRNEDRTPNAVIPMQMMAEDDFGITTLKLVVDRLGDKKHWEIPLVANSAALPGTQWERVDSNSELQRFKADYSWDLGKLMDPTAKDALKSGDVLEYAAVVTDNFELNGKTHAPVTSGKLRLTIISQDEADAKATDLLTTVAEQTAAVKQAQLNTQKQTQQLAKDLANKPANKSAMDKADQTAADRLAGQQSTLAAQAKSLATKLAELQARMEENKSTNQELKDTTRDVKDLLNSAAENPMKNAAGDINNARQEPARDQRDHDLSDAQQSQAKAADDLQKALDRLGPIGKFSQSIENVSKLLADQQKLSADTADAGKKTLGKTADQLSPEEKKKLDDLAREQADLSDRAQKMMDQLARDSEKLTKSDPAGAKAMSDAAQTGTQQNVPGNQKKAADATKQNQQSQAQSSQKQAELGLQMMLADLKEAQKHKLDELAKKLAELQQQVAILIRQQAGYNLDNLNLQAGNQINRLPSGTKLDLFTESERDPTLPLAPVELGFLSSSQEQTERNTRDIAKAAEDLPDGAQPADHLTQAADKMERAIVYLRDSKLPEAYNPPQTDALAALLEAKKLIDAQKKKADKKQDDQKREEIRQQYMALLAAQNEVNIRTTAIDATHRDEDGNLPREALVKLGQLPGEQGKVADTAAKMDEDLATLGSIVYSYANKDIIKNMNEVKELLGKQNTGVLTQAEEKQVVAQLEAMIRDLQPKPEESEFAQESDPKGGGGGGGKQPSMPTEAELRLIKDLQIAENGLTQTIAAQAKPEKSDMTALAVRQGDLRGLLDRLIQKASKNKSKLPPEPKDDQQLPEETKEQAAKDPNAVIEKIDDDELDKDLIGDGKTKNTGTRKAKPPASPEDADHDLKVVGDRMGRARQRLASSDPGPVTQEIQKRILENMDDLIEQARQKESQQQNSPPPPPGQSPPKPAPDAKPDPNAKPQDADAKGKEQKSGQAKEQAAAQASGSTPGGGDGNPGEPGPDVAHQQARMWGDPPPKQRDAVEESKGEIVLDKYKSLVDDYYRTMSTKASGK
jgi:hypothetical protein